MSASIQSRLSDQLAKPTGLESSQVLRVLDELGLSDALDQLKVSVAEESLSSIGPDDVRLSIKVGRALIAR